ncbi:MAG: leucine-rich repeat domain-containing protein [Bacteroidales bacterium]|nr:leucine-rich repeat domain-containing protein [Bacteroidales bacterium]
MKITRKILFPFVILLCFAACKSPSKIAQPGNNSGYCPHICYKGVVTNGQDTLHHVNIELMQLLDSTMLGSYQNVNQKQNFLNIAGRREPDDSLFLALRDTSNTIVFLFKGKYIAGTDRIKGSLFSEQSEGLQLEAQSVSGESYWDYIHKNRGYYEYADLEKAIRAGDKVKSIDVARQNISQLPDQLDCLTQIESISLLGNQFDTFPTVLSRMTSLDEISLSGNRLTYIGPEIRQLKNLRILIINFNRLKELPPEIGELSNLLYLDVSSNGLTKLPEEMKKLTKLQELHVEQNPLTEEDRQQLREWLPNCKIHFKPLGW